MQQIILPKVYGKRKIIRKHIGLGLEKKYVTNLQNEIELIE